VISNVRAISREQMTLIRGLTNGASSWHAGDVLSIHLQSRRIFRVIRYTAFQTAAPLSFGRATGWGGFLRRFVRHTQHPKNCFRHGSRISTGHKSPVCSCIENFPRPARTIGAHRRTPTGERVARQALPQGRKDEQGSTARPMSCRSAACSSAATYRPVRSPVRVPPPMPERSRLSGRSPPPTSSWARARNSSKRSINSLNRRTLRAAKTPQGPSAVRAANRQAAPARR
jgi:hypothetical protein